MNKFSKTLRGYNPSEVNKFVDEVIVQVEEMINQLKEKENLIIQKGNEINVLKERLEHYETIEGTLNKAILAAEEASDSIKKAARQESSMILEEAKRNANRIINEALLRAEKTEFETSMLRKNINVFKRRLKDILESQLETIDEIETLEL
jgi:cell division initiation protein